MTEIRIEDVRSTQDLLLALASVASVFTDPAAFEIEAHTFTKRPAEEPDLWPKHRGEPDLFEVDQPDVPRGRHRADDTGPSDPFVPCPNRGSHQKVTECAICWSQIQRGFAIETEVLSDHAWDLSLKGLLDEDSQ